MCREGAKEYGKETLCIANEIPKHYTSKFHPHTNNQFICENNMAILTPYEQFLGEILGKCLRARTPDGSIDRNVLLKVADSEGLTSYDEILFFADVVDDEIRKLNK